MLIANAAQIPFAQFIKYLLIPTAITLTLNALALMIVYNRELTGHSIIWTEANFERELPQHSAGEVERKRLLTLALEEQQQECSGGPPSSSRSISPRSAVRRRLSADETGVPPELLPESNDEQQPHDTSQRQQQVRARTLSVSSIVAEEGQLVALAAAQPSSRPRHSGGAGEEANSLAENIFSLSGSGSGGSESGNLEDVLAPNDGDVLDENPFLISIGASHDPPINGGNTKRNARKEDQEIVLLQANDIDASAGQEIPMEGEERKQSHHAMSGAYTPLSNQQQQQRRQRQQWHPDLDVSQEWDRNEYIRRCQLEFFYHVRVPLSSAAGNAENEPSSRNPADAEQQPDSSPAPPQLAYRPGSDARYAAPPLPEQGSQQQEILLANRARARANGVVSPVPEEKEEGNGAAVADISSSQPAAAPLGRLVLQPPSYASLRFAAARPAAADATRLSRFLSSRGWPHTPPSKMVLFSLVLLGTLLAFLSGIPLAWAALGGALVMLLIDGVDPDSSGLWLSGGVDWSLLIFFSALFIVVEGFAHSLWPLKAWESAAPYFDVQTAAGVALYSLLILIGSNTVSNVPLVLILAPSLKALPSATARHTSWLLLAFVSTLAGNLTLVGSVANLIVVARARPWYTLTFTEYAKFGAWTTCAFIAIGTAIVALELR